MYARALHLYDIARTYFLLRYDADIQNEYLKRTGYILENIAPYLDVILAVRGNEMKKIASLSKGKRHVAIRDGGIVCMDQADCTIIPLFSFTDSAPLQRSLGYAHARAANKNPPYERKHRED